MANHQQSSTPTINMINPLYLIVAVIWCFYLLPSSSIACSCFYSHPQEHFCTSDFVVTLLIQGDPKRLTNGQSDGQTGYLKYPVKVNKIFKGIDKTAVRKGFIYTGTELSSCAPTFTPNVTYLMTGRIVDGKPFVSLCNFIAQWSHLKVRQKKGFRRNFARACGCKVIDAEPYSPFGYYDERNSANHGYGLTFDNNRRRSSSCQWDTKWEIEFDCQADYSTCTPLSTIPDVKPVTGSTVINNPPGPNDVTFNSYNPFNPKPNPNQTKSLQRKRSKLGQKCQWDPNPDYLNCLQRKAEQRKKYLESEP
ncbi:metalloproteinase inhibitor 3-like [Panonychus citri]|uniref:metalloproteinase inhibitor 3-like n=1 Tax=Panonychus citri TaxID=50023 RepID=UPI002306EBC6|nr:metalloproteinase inhibitor 3-like [Panonychus citri]XP_053200608.1 metalloproteinase inhibitor 3-like [Panonychus citri]XP_053200609.1 metalloproteinase inhibitor 3-like [Panonychus citri]XP_053200610.1 metalloproteinase inhibitor 3-like [Panonychus citri]